MNSITDAVERYLEMETDYSLLINGKWGVGKTYYLKNTIFPKIKETETLKSANKKYLPIYISLFGLNSVNDLERVIFNEAFSFLKSPAGKKVFGLARAITRGYLEHTVVGDIDKQLKNIGIEKFPVKKYDDIVICLDDIERKGSGLSVEELAGYINHLCDGFGIKMILLMNEEMVIKQDVEQLKKLKEKVIGIQIDIVQNFKDVFESIVAKVYDAEPKYQNFLLKNFQLFSSLILKANGNLRTIKYLLQHFSPIFYDLELYIKDNPAKKEMIDVIEAEFPELLKFALCIAIEFRTSAISFTDRKELGSHTISRQLLKAMNMASNKDEETYKDQFIAKYYTEGNLKFYNSIFEPVVGGPKFQLNALLKELEGYYGVTDDVVPEHYSVIRKLSPPNVYNLDDEDYRAQIKLLFNYAKDGKYKIGDYLLVFELITRYGLDVVTTVEDLVSELNGGIDLSFKTAHSDHQFNQRIVGRSTKFPDAYDDLNAYINGFKKDYRSELHRKNFERLKDTFFRSPVDLIRVFATDRELQMWDHTPFLTPKILDEYIPIFDHYINLQLNSLIEFFSVRYSSDRFSSFLFKEREFLVGLKTHIETLLVGKPASFSRGLLDELQEQLSNIFKEQENQ